MSTGATIIEQRDPSWAFNAYEAARSRLPANTPSSLATSRVDSLAGIADSYDVFLLDAYGVLNVGERAIEGAIERVNALRALGKTVMVVTNAAGYPNTVLHQRYQRLGYTFEPEHVVSSRSVLLANLAKASAFQSTFHWGVMASPDYGRDELPASMSFLLDDAEDYARADGFLLMGSTVWTEDRQALLEAAMRTRSRPVWVANPDIVAPVEGGMSCEPGYYAHRLADATGCSPVFFGKPFDNVFAHVRARLPRGTADHRIVMVGDSLHTDILGGNAAGFASALITDYGFFAGVDPEPYLQSSGIRPTHIMPRP